MKKTKLKIIIISFLILITAGTILNSVTADIAVKSSGSSWFIFSEEDSYYNINSHTGLKAIGTNKYTERNDLAYLNEDMIAFAANISDDGKILRTFKHNDNIYFELYGGDTRELHSYDGVYIYNETSKDITPLENSEISNVLRTAGDIQSFEFFTEVALNIYPNLYEKLVELMGEFKVEYDIDDNGTIKTKKDKGKNIFNIQNPDITKAPDIDSFYMEKGRVMFMLFYDEKLYLYEYFPEKNKIKKICKLTMDAFDIRILK
ncbi:MAG: hypothetical protein LBM93_06985 [Oscillospiraceae bacterium]|jgi:hypothetical protein|nr:hypothetical protein [Oscillospiraceae bacterium]